MRFSFLNTSLVPVKRVFSLMLLLFLFGKANAQDELPVDSTITVEEAQDEEDDGNPAYFTKTWMYATDSIRLKRLRDNSVNDWKKDKAFWYADSVFRNTADRQSQEINNPPPSQGEDRSSRRRSQPQEQEYKSAAASPFVQTLLLVIVIAGFAGFIIYYLVSNKGMFRKQKNLASDETEEEETEDIFAINYQKEIDKAAAAGNFRYAIRLQFLRLLKNMAEKNIIQYKQDRTNLDYLTQLSASPHYNDFFRITRNYEYSWYGHFEVDAEKYRLISNDFNNFKPGWS